MNSLPKLDLTEWQATRDSLQVFAKLLGKLKQALVPPEKHYWHFGLYIGVAGLTTGPMPVAGQLLEVSLDFATHHMIFRRSDGMEGRLALGGHSARSLYLAVVEGMQELGAQPQLDAKLFASETTLPYDAAQAAAFWQALARVAGLLQGFRAGFLEEASPIQLFPHHFDLSLTWFSGRKVPGVDPKDEDAAYEQMGFGFSSGDEAIPEAYLYVTAYPVPERWVQGALPAQAHWRTEGWTGAVLPYAALVASHEPDELVLDFLASAKQARKV